MPPALQAISRLLPLVITGLLAAQHDGVIDDKNEGVAPGIDYLRDVRPILAQHCYGCHGPDERKRKADLRLDRKADALADLGGYAAIVPGNHRESELIARIVTDVADDVMPPQEQDDALAAGEIETLKRWIDAGAPWQEHWAFVQPIRPTIPPVADGSWMRNEIDAFVLARLERNGLRPSAEADRATWLRRVTFDLIGLPPTLPEIDAFLRDRSADAHERVVDRLLQDERYGERMASVWLDLARYADSSGYQRDSGREAWKWRDWVIQALNDNMPFDQFTIEQLAGDLLPNATLEQKIATGFNRNHPVNTEAGEELDEYRSAYVIDRVHTTATTFLGLTIACAQCHDHKYDPISQREFYSFYGFFNSIKEKDSGRGRNPKPTIAAPGPDEQPLLADLDQRIELLKQRLERADPIADAMQAKWEQATRDRLGSPIEWTVLPPTEFMARYGSRLRLQDDGSVLATGPTPSRDTYDLVFTPGKRVIQALRIEVLPDPSLPHGASGRADDGRFILSRLTSRISSVSDSSDPPPIAYAVVAADINQERDRDEHYLTAITPGSIESSIAVEDGSDGGSSSFRRSFGGWSISGEARKQPRHAVLVPMEPLKSNDTSILRLTLEHRSRSKFKSLIGRFRVSFTSDPRIRQHLVPLARSHWRSIGPFPARSVEEAFATSFDPEKNLGTPNWKKKYDQPIVVKNEESKTPAKAAPDAPPRKSAKPDPNEKPDARGKGTRGAMATAPKPAKSPASAQPKPANRPRKAMAADMPTAKQAPKRRPKPKRLAWQEQRTWRDGSTATIAVEGAASATYLSRKLETARARTARIEFRGGEAAKVWLNGKLVADFPPSTPQAQPAAPSPSAGQTNFAAVAFDSFRGSRSSSKPRELRIGLRKGTNHLVVKLVGKGKTASTRRRGAASTSPSSPSMSRRRRPSGISFSFETVAEGDDVIGYETLLAVRARAGTPIPTSWNAATDAAAHKRPKKDADLSEAERHAKIARRWYRRNIDPAGRVLAAELSRLESEKRSLESKLPSALVMEELDEPRPTHVFVRGDYRRKGERVQVGTPSMLPPMPKNLPRNRLGLAKWLVSGDHPLTARVTVNRAWQQFFGRGLVSTPEDFGIRGAPPSHPKLLDWLATEFVQSGWDLKQLHKRIVLSATYRQTGKATAAALASDPDNIMLARGPHLRLTAEMVRDQALFVSGLLTQKIGGESIKPYQPDGLWRATLGSGRWLPSKGDDRYRRGLYVYWKRGVPYPSFMAFDAAKRETCTVQRSRTTTPLQALVTLNDPVYVEAGRKLGERMRKDGGPEDASRIAYGFRLIASRKPEPKEVEVLASLLDHLRKHYQQDASAAKLAIGMADEKQRSSARGGNTRARRRPPPPQKQKKQPSTEAVPPAEAAAWAQLGTTLLNLEAAIRRG